MVKYVLRIVDGEQEGQRCELPRSGTFRIGRRKGCDLALTADEKISGNHCELVFEEGVVILRDLESTNGTRVDGKRIQEIPVLHGDRFQVGQTTIELVDEDRSTVPPADDMGLEIDANLLRRSSRRSPVALLLLVLILAVGGAAWWFFLRPNAPRRGKRGRPIEKIAGNLLSEGSAHVEGDAAGWLPLSRGGAFLRSGGARTGFGALRADLGGAGAGGGPVFAVAIPESTWNARRNAAYQASAWFRTEGEVRVALRLCFFRREPPPEVTEPEEEAESVPRFTRHPEMVVGTPLKRLAGGQYQELTVRAAPPFGAEEVTVALVAVLPSGRTSEEARVFVDDIALVETAAGQVAQSLQVKSRNVFAPDPAICSLCVNDGALNPLRALSVLPPAGQDAPLEALAEVLPLPASDLHGRLQMDVHAAGLKLIGGGGGRMVLHVGEDVLEGGSYRVRRRLAGEGGAARDVFELYQGETQHEAVTGLYWGGNNRILVVPSAPIALRVEEDRATRTTRFVLGYSGELDVRLVFEGETLATIELKRKADTAFESKDYGTALRLYGRILQESPFDANAVQRATLMRGQMLTRARGVFEQLERDFDEAKAFRYEGLYRALLARLEELEDFQSEFGPQIAAFREQVALRLAEVEREKGEVRGARLVEVGRALKQSGSERLARLIAQFVGERFPGTDAAKDAAALLGEK